MSETFRPVARALLSVSDKTGLVPFARALAAMGVALVSTGGTARALAEAGLAVTDVASVTGFPEMLDGRVKTLHPAIHGGILARRDVAAHLSALDDHRIGAIDLVVVNLYPFAATVARGAPFDDCIENIDIGGPSLIRAAAKNHDFVTVVTDPADYDAVLAEMKAHHGATTLGLRRALTASAFARTAAYDAAIAHWFAQGRGETFPQTLVLAAERAQLLRYGENPHQQAALYVTPQPRPGVATARQVQGKELSYNNLNDTDAAYALAAEFAAPAVAIIKHANPCGVAVSLDGIGRAYDLAWQTDPTSAFGGIIAFNRELDGATARAIVERQFVEVVLAPAYADEALKAFAKKGNVRVLEIPLPVDGTLANAQPGHHVKRVGSGLLIQTADTGMVGADELKIVTRRAPTEAEVHDLIFAWKVAKFVKSNAIVYARDRQTIGIGAGQMSRVYSARIAGIKAADEKLEVRGSVMASDAFFPFRDGIDAAAAAGIRAVIQPGGSMRDAEVIAAADEHDIAMVFTGMRHFRH